MAKLTKAEILDTYRDKSEIEHILTRSEMYVGSKSPESKVTNIVNDDDEISNTKITHIPAILKVIDEVLSNSVDEYRKNLSGVSKSGVNKIKVTIRKSGHITIEDNGGIPSDIHPKNNQPIPSFLFSNLRTSTNYNDDKSRSGTGLNGVGAVLTNIFSKRFTVTTSLNPKGKKYIKTWRNNLSITEGDKFEPSNGFKGSIFDWEIDFSKFSLDDNQNEFINDEMISLLKRRCIDVAGANINLEISLHIVDTNYKRKWKFKSFKDYISTFAGIDKNKLIGEKTKQWEIYYYPNADKLSYEIGFVNGAECNIGRHFDVAHSEAVNAITKLLKKHKITCDYKQFINSCHVFINMSVPKPVYSNQTKEKLSTKAIDLTDNGIPVISDNIKKQLSDSELIQLLLDWVKQASSASDRKKLRDLALEQKKVKVDKLVDANEKVNRSKCELWIFEGESASSGFRNARIPEVQGKYDLKGKVMNTYGMSKLKIFQSNIEYRDLITVSGLPIDGDMDIDKLRYGKYIICTDMDVDGDSIACMLIFFFNTHYREIIERGMLYRAIAPIISAKKGTDVRLFNTVKEFDDSGLKGYSVRYLKGTGSMNAEEYRMMIQDSNLQRIEIDPKSDDLLNDWFSPDVSKRKKYFESELVSK